MFTHKDNVIRCFVCRNHNILLMKLLQVSKTCSLFEDLSSNCPFTLSMFLCFIASTNTPSHSLSTRTSTLFVVNTRPHFFPVVFNICKGMEYYVSVSMYFLTILLTIRLFLSKKSWPEGGEGHLSNMWGLEF